MAEFRNRIVLELGRNVRLFLKVEAGLAGLGAVLGRIKSRLGAKVAQPSARGPSRTRAASPQAAGSSPPMKRPEALAEQNRKLRQARQQLADKDRQLAELREKLAISDTQPDGIRPENLIWMFGIARSGSSWLSAMMRDVKGHARWNEPYVGDVFGYAYFVRAWDWQRERSDYILGKEYKNVWLKSIRNFILDGATARFPSAAKEGYLVVKEPNGSIGAPLIMEALPESRMILLIRDPRDVVASLLAALKKGSWGTADNYRKIEQASADENPDEFVRVRARLYMASLERAKQAYEAHGGRKVAVRYEVLRYNTLDELRRIYSELDVPVEEKELQRIVEKHAWENIPEEKKGPDKPRRKATPGGWQEDLTPEQAKTVEEITAPVIEEFYSKQSGRVGPG